MLIISAKTLIPNTVTFLGSGGHNFVIGTYTDNLTHYSTIFPGGALKVNEDG